MEELSLDNILSEDQMEGLFADTTENLSDNKEETEKSETKTENNTTTEVDTEELFDGPESVGSEENKGEEDTVSTDGTSPNFYSSIANALVEDGVFQNLNKEELTKVKSAEDFAEFISEQVKSKLDETQRRVDEALNLGIEPTEIQKYENYLNTLENITDDRLSSETAQGETIRKNLIYQDYINRGFSKERAIKYTERSIKEGTDIDDAKEALQSNKEFFKKNYEGLIKKARDEEAALKKEYEEQSKKFHESIMNNDKVFGDFEIDKNTRQKVYDSVMKPVYTDPNTGERLTAVQKYESENRAEFLKNVGLMYVLTDGFKNLDGFVKPKVKKGIKKGLKELEHTINNTSRNSDGSLSFMSGVGDFNSKSSKWDLDL